MIHIERTTENAIAKVTNEYSIDTTSNMYFINGYALTECEEIALNKLLEECEHITESMDNDIYYGFDNEYIIIDWYGEDI